MKSRFLTILMALTLMSGFCLSLNAQTTTIPPTTTGVGVPGNIAEEITETFSEHIQPFVSEFYRGERTIASLIEVLYRNAPAYTISANLMPGIINAYLDLDTDVVNYMLDLFDSNQIQTNFQVPNVTDRDWLIRETRAIRDIVESVAQSVVRITATTNPASNITATSATLGGQISAEGNASVDQRGIEWGLAERADNRVPLGAGTGGFSHVLTNLSPNTTYYFRVYASNQQGTTVGEWRSFRTTAAPAAVAPSVTTANPSSVGSTSAVLGGNVTAGGSSAVTRRGVVIGSSPNPQLNQTGVRTVEMGTGTGAFSSTVSNLTASTQYYVRAFATNNAGTSYGSNITFTTPAPAAVAPSVTTANPSSVGSTSAVLGGNVTADGGAAVTARGVVVGTSPNPQVGQAGVSVVNVGTGTGTFSTTVSGLTASTQYHVRAFATNSAGTRYGSNVAFTTAAPPLLRSHTEVWLGTAPAGGDWFFHGNAGNAWGSSFGFYFATEGNWPWIFHFIHGWLYVQASSRDSVWFWDLQLGWWWSGESNYPFLYRADPEAVMWFYAPDSSLEGRWFYNYNSSPPTWEEIPGRL
jgi:hypothetical protein